MSFVLDYQHYESLNKYTDSRAPARVEDSFGFEDLCRYCDSELSKVFTRSIGDPNFDKLFEPWGCRYFDVYECPDCGWWQKFSMDMDDSRCGGGGDASLNKAVLRKYEIDSMDVPISALSEHIHRKHNDIFEISFQKMEELVGEVFREHFDCEVIHCGQTGDRGIDLLVIDGNQKFPVQVKRRMTPGKTESVSVVRELLGVMFRDQFTKGMVVSTADHFSKQALFEAHEVVDKGLLSSFELVDLNSFLSILDLQQNEKTPKWEMFLPDCYKSRNKKAESILSKGFNWVFD